MKNRKEIEGMYIKSYAKDLTPIKLLERAINIFFEGEMQHDIWSRELHMLGFQGLKRWHKLQSLVDRENRVCLQHEVIDIFGVNIEVQFKKTPKSINSLEEYYRNYLDWEIYVYEELNEIANELVENGYNEEANYILKDLKGVKKEVEKVRRHIQDAEIVQYDMSYLKIMDKELHKRLKPKEEIIKIILEKKEKDCEKLKEKLC